jgi:voltage-gated potassium channel
MAAAKTETAKVAIPVDKMSSSQRTINNLGYQVFMVGISLLAVANAAILIILNGDPLMGVPGLVDALLTPIFLVDFVLRMAAAKSKWRYFFLQFGWADLLGSLWLPGFDSLRIFRLYRVITIVRQMPRPGGGRFWGTFRASLANSVLGAMTLLAILVLEIGGIAVLFFERSDASANITTPGDALWWGIVTIATVGYGDRYPITPGGRMVGTIEIITGVAVFSTISGYLANAFVSSRHKEGEQPALEIGTGDTASAEVLLAEVKRLGAAQEQRAVDLEARLARMEALLGAQAGVSAADGNGALDAGTVGAAESA